MVSLVVHQRNPSYPAMLGCAAAQGSTVGTEWQIAECLHSASGAVWSCSSGRWARAHHEEPGRLVSHAALPTRSTCWLPLHDSGIGCYHIAHAGRLMGSCTILRSLRGDHRPAERLVAELPGHTNITAFRIRAPRRPIATIELPKMVNTAETEGVAGCDACTHTPMALPCDRPL